MRQMIAKKFENIKKPMGNMNNRSDCTLPLINLGIGDLDITTDSIVIEKAMNDAKAGFTHYTDPYGILELRQLIAEYHKKNFTNYEFEPKSVLITTSASHGLSLALKSILNDGEEIILLAPFFPVYRAQIEHSGGIPVIVHTKFENNFQLVKEDIENKITSKTKAIIINTPGNPTGVCYNQKSMEIVRDLAVKYDILVIADDVYDFFSYDTPFIPAIAIEGMRDRCISICSFSKNFAMTGWRIGYAISDVYKLIDTMEFINESLIYSPPAPSQRAAFHALSDFERIRAKNIPIFRERIEYCYERTIKIPEFDCFKSQGGIYLFINISKTGMTAPEFASQLLNKCNVLMIDGTPFGAPEFVRIACTLEIGKLKEAFDRVEGFLGSLR
ncbi:MAG: aminotransferase class I/II-fold pyridoxal phosphate-dependent enzyme [Fusobacteriaceae bacterium]|nr:aminotransferase class I/II-fold pyridoxal phosphate-dependent enzyme [Fusobacteriaceae bacterium]